MEDDLFNTLSRLGLDSFSFPVGTNLSCLLHNIQRIWLRLSHIQCPTLYFSSGVKLGGREADYWPASGAETKNAPSCYSSSRYVYVACSARISLSLAYKYTHCGNMGTYLPLHIETSSLIQFKINAWKCEYFLHVVDSLEAEWHIAASMSTGTTKTIDLSVKPSKNGSR